MAISVFKIKSFKIYGHPPFDHTFDHFFRVDEVPWMKWMCIVDALYNT